MTPSRWGKVEEIYQAVLKLAPGERNAFLNGADPRLRSEVEALLARATTVEDTTLTVIGVGAKLGPYEIEAPIGKGGMGQVFRAVDTRLGRKVAIKVSNKEFDARFEREARAISSLNHPHICTLYDVGPNYLVMELVEGDTLTVRLKKGKFSFEETTRYGSQIASALAEAHSKGITHRDLKPGNVMLSKNGAKVLDFGLAKLHAQPDDGLTQANVIMGTPAYMAPEQREGKACDARTDIFALGLILYEMASGICPPQDASPSLDKLPEKLAHVIARCLAADPDERWQAAKDVNAELTWAGAYPSNTQRGSEPREVPFLKATLKSALEFAALTAIFLFVHFIFRTSSVGEHFKQFEAELLQTMLSPPPNSQPLPIIINISAVRAPFSTTDRGLLDSLIRELDKKQVRAIGVDIDFSPLDNGQPVTPDDWDYFNQWLTLTKKSGLKLHLGVYRRATDVPESWLGRQSFAELAAGIARPVDDPGHSFASMGPRENGDNFSRLPQMATALYKDTGDAPIRQNVFREGASAGSISTAIYRINYSQKLLDDLKNQTIDYTRLEDLNTAENTGKVEFRGKVVLIGDATGFEDQFCRPFSAMPIAGAIAHAASLVTLREGGLEEIDGARTTAWDLSIGIAGCAFLIIFPWFAKVFWNASQWKYEHSLNAEKLYCIFASLLIFTFGLLVVKYRGIFWPDFLWAAAALLLHPFVRETLFPFLEWIWNGLGSLFGTSPGGVPHGK